LLVMGPNWNESYYISRDSPLQLFDVATGAELRIVAGFPRIRHFSISPDGKLVAACGPGGLRIWDTATGTLRAAFNCHRGEVTTIAFSPDGSALISAAFDGTLLVWDVAALLAIPPIADLTKSELDALWADLASEDAAKAGLAIRRLANHPRQATEFLGAMLKAETANAGHIARLVDDLDSPQPKVRASATRELEKLGEIAEPALKACLAGQPTLEQKMRADNLLARLGAPISDAEKLRNLRCIEVLELFGTPQTVEVLRALSGGADGSYVTREARAALRHRQ
jgi:WD domain, G-beta repeat